MKPGPELDHLIARDVMGSSIVKSYSTDLNAAFDVARKLGVTLIPIEGGQWFALVGPSSGWKSPGEFLEFLSKADFARSGAAVADSPAYSICIAAYNAVLQRGEEGKQQPAMPENVIGLTH
jgi:hypothetical protein